MLIAPPPPVLVFSDLASLGLQSSWADGRLCAISPRSSGSPDRRETAARAARCGGDGRGSVSRQKSAFAPKLYRSEAASSARFDGQEAEQTIGSSYATPAPWRPVVVIRTAIAGPLPRGWRLVREGLRRSSMSRDTFTEKCLETRSQKNLHIKDGHQDGSIATSWL